MISRLSLASAVAVLLLGSNVALAMTDVECTAEWGRADVKRTGAITEADAPRYFASLRVANKTVDGNRLTESAFLEQCKAGAFDKVALDAGAPMTGANSFTEAQAKDRAFAAGLGSVSVMKKDDKGIWRGTATDGGKNVNVSIDYKGNVVAN